MLALAPAKLTVSLHITGVRSDGYHLIDAEMVSLDLADELVFTDGDGLTIVDARGLAIPTDETNLVNKALRAVDRTAHVTLTKRIPAGAGLGGGSADAAAVLRWADCRDVAVATALGADVPFCLRGGRARVQGIGDHLTALPHEPRTYTLLTPPFGVSTPAVYRQWDALGGPRAEGPNDLEPAALHVEPRLQEWKDRLEAATGRPAVLAGSGSTWFVEGAHEGPGHVITSTIPPSA